jgi:hypothetical protein
VQSPFIGSTPAATVFASNLNVSLSTTGSDQSGYISTVVLTGSAVAPANFFLQQASTAFASCLNSAGGLAAVTPAQCHSGTVPTGTLLNSLLYNQVIPDGTGGSLTATTNYYSGVLTVATLSNIAVLSGQTVMVTVTLSFH